MIAPAFAQDRPPLHAEARGLVMRLVGQDGCSHTGVAALLGIHPRTFHRHLAGEGTSFQRIKDEVRRDLLGYYLARTSLDLSSISERLGFAEQSVLSRSCRRWFGASPSQMRRQGPRVRTHDRAFDAFGF
jgi:AraC-like DNA-binding protein